MSYEYKHAFHSSEICILFFQGKFIRFFTVVKYVLCCSRVTSCFFSVVKYVLCCSRVTSCFFSEVKYVLCCSSETSCFFTVVKYVLCCCREFIDATKEDIQQLQYKQSEGTSTSQVGHRNLSLTFDLYWLLGNMYYNNKLPYLVFAFKVAWYSLSFLTHSYLKILYNCLLFLREQSF